MTTRRPCFSPPPAARSWGATTPTTSTATAWAASVNLDTIACVVPNGSRTIRVKSRHHRMAEVDLDELSRRPEETGNSVSLVRGVAARISQLGYQVGGFDAYTTTRVLRGSGLSSSAAFEVLVSTILNHLFCGGALTTTQLAQISQYAENAYFGKPCGLMDQLSCATGGVIAIDFKDPAAPTLRQVQADLDALGYALCVIDSRASHADLTADYAAITREMCQVAACFGREVLGDVDPDQFRRSLSTVRATCGDRAALRAIHFFQDDRRVELERRALEAGDMDAFLHHVRQSGRSSSCTCRTCPTTGRAAPSPSPCCWRWRRTCWRAGGPAGSTAAASPAPSRPSSPLTRWRALWRAWRPSPARGPAMC